MGLIVYIVTKGSWGKHCRTSVGCVEAGIRYSSYGNYMKVEKHRKDQCIYIWILKDIQVDIQANVKDFPKNSNTKGWCLLGN